MQEKNLNSMGNIFYEHFKKDLISISKKLDNYRSQTRKNFMPQSLELMNYGDAVPVHLKYDNPELTAILEGT